MTAPLAVATAILSLADQSTSKTPAGPENDSTTTQKKESYISRFTNNREQKKHNKKKLTFSGVNMNNFHGSIKRSHNTVHSVGGKFNRIYRLTMTRVPCNLVKKKKKERKRKKITCESVCLLQLPTAALCRQTKHLTSGLLEK